MAPDVREQGIRQFFLGEQKGMSQSSLPLWRCIAAKHTTNLLLQLVMPVSVPPGPGRCVAQALVDLLLCAHIPVLQATDRFRGCGRRGLVICEMLVYIQPQAVLLVLQYKSPRPVRYAHSGQEVEQSGGRPYISNTDNLCGPAVWTLGHVIACHGMS